VKRVLVLIVVLLCAILAGAAEVARPSRPELLQGVKSIDDDAELQEWLTFYYLHPRPELTVSAWKRMAQAKLFSREDMRPGVVAFYAGLFRREPSLSMKLVPEVHDSDSRFVLASATWLTNADNAVDVIDALSKSAAPDEKAVLKDLTYRAPPDIATKPITSEWDLDALWGTFFATGADKYVQKISSALAWTSDPDPVRQSIAQEAHRTLVSNGVGHPRVLKICEADLSRATNPQKDALAAVLTEAREQANRTH
jgi:hypothetical protein